MPELPRGTVTFLFTDIEGSTRLWQGHREAMERAYGRHDHILREVITQHGGVVYKVIGDALQVAFPTAPAAVAAALHAQLALQGEEWSAHGLPEPLRVRMALHTGAVEPDPDGDYRSPVLNRLGRLLGAGHGGQVLLSDVVGGLTRDHLSEGASLHDLGEHRLKDLGRPERVFQVVHPALAAAFPPLVTLDIQLHNLPVQPTPLIGREREVAQLTGLLRQSDVRLVTLTGPGGTGKTRLALQAAAEVVEQFADGVWFVDLSPLSDPALVPGAIAEVLGVRETGGTPLAEVLQEHLRDQQVLLVLDNLEQLVPEAAGGIGDLLAASPDLTVLATSRVPLRLRAEREVAVPPLGLPRRKPPPTLQQLGQYEAVRLFIARAEAVKANFAVTNANAPAIAEICHRLDGLPLAIELAAARIRMLPPDAMLARLHSRLPLLTGGARDLPARQQTLRGAIAWSYELLSADEQALFRRLSVFAGGATFEAIEAVAAGDKLGLDLFDGLERLVEHSLVRQTETAGEPRFGMLETIREYGLEHLETSGEAEEAHRRHATYYLALAEEAEPALLGPGQGMWLDRLEDAHDNLRAALAWAVTVEPATALHLGAALWRFWQIRGHLTEGRSWLDQVLATDKGAPSVVRVRVLEGSGVLGILQGDLPQGFALLERSLALARALGDRLGIIMALTDLGGSVSKQGDFERAEKLLEEALAVAGEDEEFRFGRIAAMGNLGEIALIRGDTERAAALMTEVLTLHRERGDPFHTAVTLDNLGASECARGNFGAATEYYQEALTLQHAIGDQEGLAYSFAGLASVAIETDAAWCAARLAGAATALCTAVGAALEPSERAALDHTMAKACSVLGEEDYAASYAEGWARTLEEAIAEALAVDAPEQNQRESNT